MRRTEAVTSWIMTAERKLPWRTDEAVAFAEARSQEKGVLLDFSATWCKPCGKLETDTFAKKHVYEKIMADYVPLKFDVTHGTAEDEAKQEKYGQSTMPEVILLDASGRVLVRIHDFVGPDEFMKKLQEADQARARSATAAR